VSVTEPGGYEGIWEVRGGPKQFVHSKLMAWVAADRAVKAVEEFGLDGPVERWVKLRDKIRQEILDKGIDTARTLSAALAPTEARVREGLK
jgi:GH15 family glucan-1,4-alpha-glucosidase